MVEYPGNLNNNEMLKEGASLALVAGLRNNRDGLAALRSYWQLNALLYLDNPTAYKLLFNQMMELRKEISLRSGDSLHYYDGSLCQISDTETKYVHSGGFRDEEGQLLAARGFYVSLSEGGFHFDAFILDHGKSRAFYDQKSKEEKEAFVRGYIERRRQTFASYIDRTDAPPTYFAILTERDDNYIVEQITPEQPPYGFTNSF